jgi:DivIVA domain-containing protein
MEMNPQRVRSAEFKTVRKGVDPDEVRVFLGDVADELERAQNQSTAMEARARAAVARLQEVTEQAAAEQTMSVDASVEESETISRTLLLAQRTADAAIADANAEAQRILTKANDEAAATLDSTREMSAQMLAEARVEAHRIGDAERQTILGEVEALKARRDFLESDVHHLETFLVDQRTRVRDAATALIDVADRVPGGLGDVRRPLLSASDDDTPTGLAASGSQMDAADDAEVDGGSDGLVIVTEVADEEQPVDADTPGADENAGEPTTAPVPSGEDPWADDRSSNDDPTEAMPVFRADDDAAAPDGDESGEEFRFSFDDERS